ncbi:hypothetical protein BY458DRAFT_523637 [Sporodiniella umbellata]|nr:hypothetical protein BY458DRAFT_523637 [Sporodiniella umbellata]
MTNDKPNVLVLGGAGLVGRHFVYDIVQKDLANHIRVVDKALPETAYFSASMIEAFEHVDYKQSDLANQETIASCFEEVNFDYVFNFAGETRYGLDEEFYLARTFDLSVQCAQEAVRNNVKFFLEMSTAEVYDHSKKPSTEHSKVDPWTDVARYKYKAEKELTSIEGLPLLIIRPALIYGPGALSGLTTRLILGRVHKYKNESLKCFWSKNLKLNTVHVRDVSNACWHLAEWYLQNHNNTSNTPIFNLADKQDTDQRVVNEHIEDIFNISTSYHNHLISTLAKIDLSAVIEGENEKTISPWKKLLEENGIENTPLTPFVHKEEFLGYSLCVDGSKIENETGFGYQVPTITHESLLEIIDEFKSLNLWPKNDIQ